MQKSAYLAPFILVAQMTASMPLAAAGLEPKAPGDLVTLRSSGEQCGANPIGKKLDLKQNSDGTAAPFEIPSGMALVVTNIGWTQGITGSPNKAEILFLHSLTPSGVIWPMVTSHDNGSADGRAGANVAVSSVAFKAGEIPCYSVNTGNIGSVVFQLNGFLIPER